MCYEKPADTIGRKYLPGDSLLRIVDAYVFREFRSTAEIL
jgi:hypothetical protein